MTMTPDLSSPEFDPRDAVLSAALVLLASRLDHMATVDEWLTLARAVARCQGTKTAAYLTEQDLDEIVEYQMDWDTVADGPLPEIDREGD